MKLSSLLVLALAACGPPATTAPAIVETRRLSGSQLDETERMERDEPVTAERIWRWSARGYRPEVVARAD